MIIEYELIYILKTEWYNANHNVNSESRGYCYEIETFAIAPCGSGIGNACGA